MINAISTSSILVLAQITCSVVTAVQFVLGIQTVINQLSY